jgi:hypothetical protein
MTRFKDFGAGAETQAEPLSFKLHGEEFTAIPEIQGAFLIELVKDSQSGDTAKSATVILDFFSNQLEGQDR